MGSDDRPSNYLIQNILVLLFCSFALGVVGLIYSLKVTFKCLQHAYKHKEINTFQIVHINACTIRHITLIFISMQVDSEWSDGRYEEAKRSSRIARNWAIAGVIVGSVILVISVAIFIVAIVVSSG